MQSEQAASNDSDSESISSQEDKMETYDVVIKQIILPIKQIQMNDVVKKPLNKNLMNIKSQEVNYKPLNVQAKAVKS